MPWPTTTAELMESVILAGLDVNHRLSNLRKWKMPDELGHLPSLLEAALFCGSNKSVAVLLSFSPKLDLVDAYGRGVAHFACIGGSAEVCKQL
jgi:hypothetical protein